jgi:isoamylase
MRKSEQYSPGDTGQQTQFSESAEIQPGSPLPFGASPRDGGVNFALFSRHADRVWLELYAHAEDDQPVRSIELDPTYHRTGDVWHVWVRGVDLGQLYAYRVDGPYLPRQGHRFNKHKLLLDPYATAITPRQQWDFGQALGYDPASAQADLSISSKDSAGAMPKCVVAPTSFDWEGDQPLRLPWSSMVIYETHVRGLTCHPSAGVQHPGTYAGVIEMLPYLKNLGVTAIELMPVHEFNENETERTNPLTGERLRNYWGYSTVSFFAPKASYSSGGGMGQQVTAFKEMVKACHRTGIEVILDVVFNHSAEGSELGPTFAFRGIDNVIYYMLADDKRYYRNYAGTGNTLNANHPVVRDFILDALRYWTVEMHVDGFRFDLAAVLDRDEQGNLLPDAPLLERIAEDPILREARIIAEAWDVAGAYQVGSFSEVRWAEWNGRYRDEVRRFWRGDDGLLGAFASRVCGSADLYQRSGKGPESSINFVTCHDGFTMNDLVSYSHKHNQANGEASRDGTDDNDSANYGTEGETDNPQIQAVRARQIKNFLVTLFVSRGVPMLLGGDEFRRTQQGNNNAYCQDNAISWLDWTLLERHQEIHRFTRGMIALRLAHPVLSREAFYTDADIVFFNASGDPPDWFNSQEKHLGIRIQAGEAPDLCLIFNAGIKAAAFALPRPVNGSEWRLAVDTQRPAPEDIRDSGDELPLPNKEMYQVGPRTSVILVSRR